MLDIFLNVSLILISASTIGFVYRVVKVRQLLTEQWPLMLLELTSLLSRPSSRLFFELRLFRSHFTARHHSLCRYRCFSKF